MLPTISLRLHAGRHGLVVVSFQAVTLDSRATLLLTLAFCLFTVNPICRAQEDGDGEMYT